MKPQGRIRSQLSNHRGRGVLGGGVAAALLLAACAPAEEPEGASSSGEQQEAAELPEDAQDDDVVDSPAEFCASGPESQAPELQEEDEERIEDLRVSIGDDPVAVPMPYLEQLEGDADYVAPSAEGPAENVPAPRIPALLCEDSVEGRMAALSYWSEVMLYSELSRDPHLLEQLHAEDCYGCEDLVQGLESIAENDEWVVGDPLEVTLHMWMPGENPDHLAAFLETHRADFTYYRGEGDAGSERAEERSTAAVEFVYDEQDGHWKQAAQLDAAMGDEALERMQQDEPEAAEIQAPEMPGEVRENSPEGALAALDYWFELFDYTRVTGDTEPIEMMMDPRSDRLPELFMSTVALVEDGAVIELDGESRAEDVRVYLEAVQTEDAAMIELHLHEAGFDAYEGAEHLGAHDGFEGVVTYALFYHDDVGHWQVFETVSASMEEIFAEGEVEAGEPDLTRD